MEVIILVIIKMDSKTAKVFINIQMIVHMKVIGMQESLRDTEFINGKMEINILDILVTINDMEKE